MRRSLSNERAVNMTTTAQSTEQQQSGPPSASGSDAGADGAEQLLQDGTTSPKHRKPPLIDKILFSIVPILFLDFLVSALPRSIVPELLDAAYGVRAYTLLGIADSIRGMLTFLTAPMLGALSDVVGRKWLFVACILGTAMPSCVLAFTHPELDAYLFAIAIGGALASTFPLAFATISDHVPRARRSSAFGIATGLGLGGAYTVGPACGATINHWYGAQTVFNLCLWITAASTLIAIFALKGGPPTNSEAAANLSTDPVERRRELMRRANPVGAWRLVRGNHALWVLSCIVFFYYLALWGFIANSLMYARRQFKLTPPAAAALLGCFGITSLLGQSVGLKLAQRFLSEPQITRRCFALSFIALCIFGVAWRPWLLYVAMTMLGISVGGFACVSSMASQVVPRAQTGEAQGVITSLKALTEGLGPLATAAALPWFEGTPLPGAPWLIAAISVGVSLALCLRLESALRRTREAIGHPGAEAEMEPVTPLGISKPDEKRRLTSEEEETPAE